MDVEDMEDIGDLVTAIIGLIKKCTIDEVFAIAEHFGVSCDKDKIKEKRDVVHSIDKALEETEDDEKLRMFFELKDMLPGKCQKKLTKILRRSKSLFPGNDSTMRGHCCIINNYEFPPYKDGSDANLKGYIKDVEKIKSVFESFRFKVVIESNLSAERMKTKIREWSELDFSDDECLVVLILSHGWENGTIYGSDMNGIQIDDDIISPFVSCEPLKGKHKLFFVQACRGDLNPQPVKVKSDFSKAGVRFEKKFQDVFVYYSTMEGYAGFVNDNSGSIFIPALCKVLEENSQQDKLWELVTKVNKKVSETVFPHDNQLVAQCPEAVYTLRSDFSFCEVASTDPGKEYIKLQKGNPCYIVTNTNCDTHKRQCKRFKEYKDKVSTTFKELNFQVYDDNDNLSGDETTKLFKDIKKSEDVAESECLVCVVLSCGGLNGSKPVIYGSDGKFLSIDIMMKKVIGNSGLVGRPKLFFMVLNKCSRETYRKAGPGGDQVPEMKSQSADTFVYYVIIEDGKSDTDFIHALCEVLSECQTKQYHIGDIMFEVNKKMHEWEAKEVPEACSTLTSMLYIGGDTNASSPKDDDGEPSYSSIACPEEVSAAPGPIACAEDPPVDEEDISSKMVFSRTFSSNYTCFQGSDLGYENEDMGSGQPDATGSELDYENEGNAPDQPDPTGWPGAPIQRNDLNMEQTQGWSGAQKQGNDLDSEQAQDWSGAPRQGNDLNMEQTQVNGGMSQQAQAQAQVQEKVNLETNLETSVTKTDCVITDILNSFQNQEDLACMLDQLKSPNWKDLGMVLVERHGKELDLDKSEVESFHLALYGGGSPATNLLNLLEIEKGGYSLHQFASLASQLKRTDISNLVKGWKKNKLEEMSEQEKKTLAQCLDKDIRGIKNWRHFANRLGFEKDKIDEMAQTVNESNITSDERSPTCMLLKRIKYKNPKFTAQRIRDIASHIGREDVAQFLDNIMVSCGVKPTVGDSTAEDSHYDDLK